MKDFDNTFHPRRPLKDYELFGEEEDELEEPSSEVDDEGN